MIFSNSNTKTNMQAVITKWTNHKNELMFIINLSQLQIDF